MCTSSRHRRAAPATLVKAKVRNLRSGNVFDRTFKTGDKVGEAQIEFRPVQYLYTDGDGYHFMDTESYEQLRCAPRRWATMPGTSSKGSRAFARSCSKAV